MSIFFYHTSLAILPLFFVLSFARFGANKLAIALSIMLGILCGFICFNAFFSIANIDNAKMFFEIFNIILLLLLPLTNIFKREYFTLWLRKARMKGLYDTDVNTQIKKSNENPMILSLYDTLLKGKEHELLHRNFSGK